MHGSACVSILRLERYVHVCNHLHREVQRHGYRHMLADACGASAARRKERTVAVSRDSSTAAVAAGHRSTWVMVEGCTAKGGNMQRAALQRAEHTTN